MTDFDNDFGFTFATAEDIFGEKNETIDEYKNKIAKLEKAHKDDLTKVEKLIVPLLNNLLKNPECEYILWKDREKPIRDQIAKILAITSPK